VRASCVQLLTKLARERHGFFILRLMHACVVSVGIPAGIDRSMPGYMQPRMLEWQRRARVGW
jgi:hypothetical protein